MYHESTLGANMRKGCQISSADHRRNGATPASRNRFRIWFSLFVCCVVPGAVLLGCRTPSLEETFSDSSDAKRVAQLSLEAYKVGWDAVFSARRDLRTAAFRP